MRVSLHRCGLRRTMDYFQILLLVLNITQVLTKSKSKSKKYQTSSSDEDSIENLLYYKDCQRKGKEEATFAPQSLSQYDPPPPPPPPPRQPECPFPKMCCALTCGNECGGSPQPAYVQRQMEPAQNNIQPIQPIQPIPQPRQPGMGAVQPQIVRRKKKAKFQPNKIQPPLATRRDFSGFTKERIKGLIAQDDDIRKILKDLVRVTMQKVDLLDMLSTNNDDYLSMPSTPTPEANTFDEYDE